MSDSASAYDEVARLFRAHPGTAGAGVVPRPATPEQIEGAERALGARLPHSFRRFQLEFGDYQDGPLDIFSVLPADPPGANLVSINRDARTVIGPRVPPYLIAFSDNGAGDYFCFDTRAFNADEAPVVVWDHELNEDQTPAAVAPSFVEWLRRELAERAAENRYGWLFRLRLRLNAIASFARDLLRQRRDRGSEP